MPPPPLELNPSFHFFAPLPNHCPLTGLSSTLDSHHYIMRINSLGVMTIFCACQRERPLRKKYGIKVNHSQTFKFKVSFCFKTPQNLDLTSPYLSLQLKIYLPGKPIFFVAVFLRKLQSLPKKKKLPLWGLIITNHTVVKTHRDVFPWKD